MHKSPSASHVKRTVKVLVTAFACYAAFAAGTAFVVTAHELAHFAGGAVMPGEVVFSPSERLFTSQHAQGTPQPTLVFYMDQFVPAVTGSAFFDPSNYQGSVTSGHSVAAAWLGHVDAAHASAVTLFPAYLAAISSAAAGVLCLVARRLPVFTFGLAVGLGGFYTLHHLVEAGLNVAQAITVAYVILALQAVPAGVGLWWWAKRRWPIPSRPARRTFRPNRPTVHGYTVMPHKAGVQFLHMRRPASGGPPGPSCCGPVGPQGLSWKTKSTTPSTTAKAQATRSTRPTLSPTAPVGLSHSSSAAAVAP